MTGTCGTAGAGGRQHHAGAPSSRRSTGSTRAARASLEANPGWPRRPGRRGCARRSCGAPAQRRSPSCGGPSGSTSTKRGSCGSPVSQPSRTGSSTLSCRPAPRRCRPGSPRSTPPRPAGAAARRQGEAQAAAGLLPCPGACAIQQQPGGPSHHAAVQPSSAPGQAGQGGGPLGQQAPDCSSRATACCTCAQPGPAPPPPHRRPGTGTRRHQPDGDARHDAADDPQHRPRPGRPGVARPRRPGLPDRAVARQLRQRRQRVHQVEHVRRQRGAGPPGRASPPPPPLAGAASSTAPTRADKAATPAALGRPLRHLPGRRVLDGRAQAGGRDQGDHVVRLPIQHPLLAESAAPAADCVAGRAPQVRPAAAGGAAGGCGPGRCRSRRSSSSGRAPDFRTGRRRRRACNGEVRLHGRLGRARPAPTPSRSPIDQLAADERHRSRVGEQQGAQRRLRRKSVKRRGVQRPRIPARACRPGARPRSPRPWRHPSPPPAAGAAVRVIQLGGHAARRRLCQTRSYHSGDSTPAR